MKKHCYRWKGRNQKGESVDGEIIEKDSAHALVKLRKQNISSIKIRRVMFSKPVSERDKISFNYQLATLLKAGIPLIAALKLIGEKNAVLKKIANALHLSVSDGYSLSDATKQHPKFFGKYECNLIAIGERTGQLDLVIEKLAQNQEHAHKLKRKVIKAINYPSLILLVTFFVIAGLMHYVVPEFEKTFKNFNSELPWLTLLVINTADIFNQHLLYLIALPILLILAFYTLLTKSKSLQISIEKTLLKTPFLKDIFGQAIAVHFSRCLEINLTSGVSLLAALENVSLIQKHEVTKEAIKRISTLIVDGVSLSQAVEQTNIFPQLVTQMIAIGEESGALEMVFSKLAEHYESEIDRLAEQMITFLEPALMLFVGAFTGLLMLALYLPMFQIGSIL